MKIKNVVCAPGRTGFYFDDQRAIKRGAGHDGMFYIGQPVTEGFSAVRQAGEAISVMLILEDGQVAYGDCAAVQYSGAGGRDPLFLAKDFIPIIEQYIKPCLVGQEADNFRALAARMEAIEVGGKRLHTAIRYGVSQALLDAVAKASGRMMCEVVADEYGCTVSDHLIPIFTQSGDDRYDNADKMIIKGAQVLPHALINNVETKLGAHGEKLQEHVFFSSPDREQYILENFSCDFTPGSFTAIVGETGIGKSTLFKLLLGLFSPDSGKVLFYDSSNEQGIAASAATRCNLSYVPQNNMHDLASLLPHPP